MKPNNRDNILLNGRFRFQRIAQIPKSPTVFYEGILCEKWKVFSENGKPLLIHSDTINEETFVTFISNSDEENEFGLYQRHEGAGRIIDQMVAGIDVGSSHSGSMDVELTRKYNGITETFTQTITIPREVKRVFAHFDIPEHQYDATMEFNSKYFEFRIRFKTCENNAKISVGNISLEYGSHEELFIDHCRIMEEQRIAYYQQAVSLFVTGIQPVVKIPKRMNDNVKTVTLKNDTGYFYDSPVLINSIYVDDRNNLIIDANKYQYGEFKHQKTPDDYLVIIDGDL
ncbi:hypothetical protein phiOC_p353 [Ochrobactrum phage vB_OspM_OC]|nr:hypothetical protein phiOC_p353 [Ochrobactrum phage vB_OspM_OC]